MKFENKNMKVDEVVSKYDKKIITPTEFQRQADAWTKKIKQELIVSILQNSYIPPLLFSQNRIIDGLQRINALHEFVNKQEFWIKSFWNDKKEEKLHFDDLNKETKSKLLDYKLLIIDLCNDDGQPLTDIEEKELFCKINTTSSKLNKAELIFTSCKHENREMILNITSNNNHLIALSQNKKLKRFQLPLLILWSLTVVYYRCTGRYNDTSKQSIRNDMEKFINFNFSNENSNEIIEKSKKTINLIKSILGERIIPPHNFKVIFSALFVAMYENLDNYNAFIANKEKLAIALQKGFEQIVKSQQIGGIHYDSYFHFKDRINIIMNILKDYIVDPKRYLSIKDKIKLYFENIMKHEGYVTCCECGKTITKWTDINVDHIFAHTKGGKTSIDNSQILCEKCNKKKNKY